MKKKLIIFKNISIVVIILEFLLLQKLYCENNQIILSNFDKTSEYVYYSKNNLISQVSRFDILQPCNISKISILTSGTKNSNARLRFFGNEGGMSIPTLEKGILNPIKIIKSKNGLEQIIIELDKPLNLDPGQIFICLDSISEQMILISDNETKEPSCSNPLNELYYDQLIQTADGIWKYCKYSFAIELYLDNNINKNQEIIFKDETKNSNIPDSILYNKNITIADLNNDGFNDIVVGGRIFKNNQDFKFTLIDSNIVFGYSKLNILLDINSDGLIDILFINDSLRNNNNCLYLNKGNFNFELYKLDLPEMKYPSGYSITDLNEDNYLDIFITQQNDTNLINKNFLLINDKNNNFKDYSNILYNLGFNDSKSVSFLDFNNDGKQDIFVVNNQTTNELWINLGNMKFKNIAFENILSSEGIETTKTIGQGCEIFDFNNDGNVDILLPITTTLYSTNQFYSKSKLLLNKGYPNYLFENINKDEDLIRFENKHYGGRSTDINNDGYNDFIITSSCKCRYPDLYMGNQFNNFKIFTYYSGFLRREFNTDLAFADLNNDGKMDIITTENGKLVILRNNQKVCGNYIDLDFNSKIGFQNIGAKVEIFTENGKLIQQLNSGIGLMIQQPYRLHFGLGNIGKIDSIHLIKNASNIKICDALDVNRLYNLDKLFDKRIQYEIIQINTTPNPFEHKIEININMQYSEYVELSIYSIDGKRIDNIVEKILPAGENNFFWDSKDYSDGYYIVKLKTKSKDITKSIIKLK